MLLPDDSPPTTPELGILPTTPVAEPVDVTSEPPPPLPEPVAVVVPAVPKKRAPSKPSVSDDTLAAWQASLAAAQAEKQRALRAIQVARERAEAFRQVRAALRHMETVGAEPEPDAELEALRSDRLALAVHAAPARTRTVIEALLRQLQR